MAYGFSAVNKNLNNGIIPNGNVPNNNLFTAVRVKNIILNRTSLNFKELGEWDALGTVEFEDVINPNVKGNAKPLFGNIKNFPLLNEIVYIFSLPSTLIGETTSESIKYYLNPVALWNHPHHNGYPTNANENPQTQQKTYIQTELGNTSKITNQPSTINLGQTFIERSNIHPLLPFEGDIIYEGRWGNSIRLGSTITTKPPVVKSLNNWSTTGSSGDPIIILRNGQGSGSSEGWLPIIEDINNDNSSIYLTSTQKIPLKPINISYDSYNIQPQSINEFSGKQILFNSGRLVLNSTNDHILLSSNKSVGLNAISSVNIDTPLTVIQSDKVLLGSKDATESMIKGDLLIIELQSLLNQLTLLTTSLQAVPQASAAATLMLSELPKISANLEKTKSQVNKLI
jgi:hypothetical protein